MNSQSPKFLDASHNRELESMPLFQGMDDVLLHGLVASARLVSYEKGKVFLEQEQAISRFYVIMDGWCGATKTNSNGQESILQIFRRGDFLPEPKQIEAHTINSLNVQALTPIRLAMFAPSLIRNALENSKAFAANMLDAFNRRCNELRDHVEQLTLRTAEERVGRFVLDMRLAIDADSNDVTLPFDKSLIAEYLGIKPETLSRAFQYFKEKGFVIDRNQLHMPDRHALCSYCDSTAEQHCRFAKTDECPQ